MVLYMRTCKPDSQEACGKRLNRQPRGRALQKQSAPCEGAVHESQVVAHQ